MTIIPAEACEPDWPAFVPDPAHPYREDPGPPPATLTDALVRMAEHSVERSCAVKSRRSRLNVHIDPLSGWGRLTDGELLPPSSLNQVLHTLPGRDRLRRVRPNDLTAHDTGRTSATPATRSANWSAPSTVSAAASRAAPAPRTCTPTTSGTGPRAAPPIWRISRSYALGTTP